MTQSSEDQLEILKIAFEEGRKGLSVQDETISSIRQRAFWIGGLSGVIATFLGREAIKSVPLSAPNCTVQSVSMLMGFVALFLVYVSIIYVIWPRKNLIFHNSPNKIIDQFVKGKNATNISTTYEALARFSNQNYESNEKIINNLFRGLLVAMIFMFVEFISWVLVIS